MASIRLELTETWQDLGAISLVGSCGGAVEIVNADSLPTGDIPAALSFLDTTSLNFPAPAEGNLYVRVSVDTGFIKYYEV